MLFRSMELAKRPKADIERVLLSRSDFTAAIVPEMMLTAAYLKRLGFNERALAMYQQASRFAPARPEPYLRGLQIARELNDAKGVEWGAVGVLTNVWLSGYSAHHHEAENVAAVVNGFSNEQMPPLGSSTLKSKSASPVQVSFSIKSR